MAKKSKKCKRCEEPLSKCKCPKKGWYGLERSHDEDDDSADSNDLAAIGGDGGGGMSEGIRMPKAPSDADKNMKDMSSEKRKRTLDNFRDAVADAKKRQKYKQENDDLRTTTIKKGVRFYDKKGSGYIKGGKKTYD